MDDNDSVTAFRVQGLDHIVLTCTDIERSLTWYTECLGLESERVDEWRRGEVFFPSVRVDTGTVIDLFPGPTDHPADHPTDNGRLDHFCLVVAPTDLQTVVDSGWFDVIEGPVSRWGARGEGTSIYIRDPDGTTIEIRHY